MRERNRDGRERERRGREGGREKDFERTKGTGHLRREEGRGAQRQVISFQDSTCLPPRNRIWDMPPPPPPPPPFLRPTSRKKREGQQGHALLLTVKPPPPSLHSRTVITVYDRIDAAATINFSKQFGVATIQEWRLFESGVYFFRHGLKNIQ